MSGSRGLDAVREALVGFAGDPIDLVVGAPCFDPPSALRTALASAASGETWRYSAVGGSPDLRRALGEVRGAPSSRIFVGHGGKGSLLALFGVLVRPGDEVVVPTPAYEAYRRMPERWGARFVAVPRMGPNFRFEAEPILRAMTDRTRAVVLSTPCNPTGAVLSDEVRDAVAEAARARGARLVLDLAYDRFRFDGSAPVGMSPVPGDSTIVELHSASKNLGVAGWRIGWVVADEELVRRLAAFQSEHLNPPSTVTQAALESIGRVPESFYASARAAVLERCDAVCAVFRDLGRPVARPAGGFYAFAEMGEAATEERCIRLARDAGVGLTPGSDFGAPGWVRAAVTGLEPGHADELGRRLHMFLG